MTVAEDTLRNHSTRRGFEISILLLKSILISLAITMRC